MQIEFIEIDKIIPNPKNPNIHRDEQIKRLVKIIKANGFRRPLTISKRSGFIVTGHGRWTAAKALGMERLPVIYQDYETEAQEYQDMTADNAIASWSDLNLDAIKEEILAMEDFDVELLGLENFNIVEMALDDDESEEEENKNEKFILTVELPNELDRQDLYDDLMSKGFMARIV